MGNTEAARKPPPRGGGVEGGGKQVNREVFSPAERRIKAACAEIQENASARRSSGRRDGSAMALPSLGRASITRRDVLPPTHPPPKPVIAVPLREEDVIYELIEITNAASWQI